MKFTCDICGCTLDDFKKMQEHERQCAEAHRLLYNCTCEITSLLSLAAATPFQIVAEMPCVTPQADDSEAPAKTELKYLQIVGTEMDIKKNRCILKVKNDEIPKPAGSKTKSNKK